MTALPVILGWSGGKDSMMALARLRSDRRYDVVGLVTSVTPAYDRISIHGVRRSLLRQQAEALGLPVIEAPLEPEADNTAYESSFRAALYEWRRRVPSITHVAFGDLFLADIRAYRERLVASCEWEPLFPVWGEPTDALARAVVEQGYRATVVCVDTDQLDAAFAGRSFDAQLLRDLPAGIDPCGENGEFHTFVFDGPLLQSPVRVTLGEVVRRGTAAYADLLPST